MSVADESCAVVLLYMLEQAAELAGFEVATAAKIAPIRASHCCGQTVQCAEERCFDGNGEDRVIGSGHDPTSE